MPDWLLRMAPHVGRGYLRLVGRTSRYSFEGLDVVERVRASGGGMLCAFWHNRLLGPLIPHRNQTVGVVISRSRDGQLISEVVEGFGYVPLRGSSSRGGGQVLRAVVKHLREGGEVAFTPDGPRGPRYEVQSGIAYAARKTGCPVVPVGVAMAPKAVFSSWDRFQVPLPFGRILLVYEQPLVFGVEHADREVAEAIRSALVEATERAEGLLGVSSP